MKLLSVFYARMTYAAYTILIYWTIRCRGGTAQGRARVARRVTRQ